MKTVDELMKEFGEVHPIFDHFGLFTNDRERATEFLLSIPGAKITVTRDCDFPAENVLIGKPMSIRIHHLDICGVDVEVIEPLNSPDGYVANILKTHGETFHHVALTFNQHKEHLAMCELLRARGYRCVFQSKVRDLLIDYWESSDNSSITLELKSVRDDA